MSTVNNPNQVGRTSLPDAGAPTLPVGTTGERTVTDTPPPPAPLPGVPGLANQQGAQAPRTVTLGKETPLLNQLTGDERTQATQAVQTHVDRAASCQQAFKDGKFQGFVNGFVTGQAPGQKIAQIKTAYRAYGDCGLAAASAQEIKAGIAGFANKIDTSPFALVIGNNTLLQAAHCQDVRAACDQYLDVALAAYPGLFTSKELEALQTDIIGRSLALIKDINETADPKITVAEAANLIKENLDKILYQQFRDQSMITGSDHGIHHIVMGNIHNSLAVLNNCKDSSDNCVVTPREKLMVLQTMVDHDLGYTTYAAQADFGAAKDHPLASRAFVDQNINQIFKSPNFQPPQIRYGAEDFIKSSILSHSYPAGLDQSLDFSDLAKRAQSLRNVVAVVDAMGTTQDTKLPSVFRQPEIQKQLFQVGAEQLKLNTLNNEQKALQELQKKSPLDEQQQRRLNALPRLITKQKGRVASIEGPCKQAMLKALDADTSMPPELKARYKQAIEVDFSAFGAGMIVPQFAGKLLNAHATSDPNNPGRHKMAIAMEVSLPERLAQSITGQADIAVREQLNAFNKMAQDIASGLTQSLGDQIDQNLYSHEAVANRKTTHAVGTPLIDFTFRVSSADAGFLDAWFAQDIDTY
ncbi:MAG: hypothetical protein LBH52_01410 [Puniceicoccales bacterium]|jgi:hypothetical protein|nr:hypothetical protein [Puniceicoccales bacterium]